MIIQAANEARLKIKREKDRSKGKRRKEKEMQSIDDQEKGRTD